MCLTDKPHETINPLLLFVGIRAMACSLCLVHEPMHVMPSFRPFCQNGKRVAMKKVHFAVLFGMDGVAQHVL